MVGLEMEQPRVQFQVLRHGQLAIQREGLRHEADALARFQIVGVGALAEQEGLPRRCRKQSGQHLHGRGLAAAV